MSDYTISLSINATDNASSALNSVASSLQSLEGTSLSGLDTASQNLLELDQAAGSGNLGNAASDMGNFGKAAKEAGDSIQGASEKTGRAGQLFNNLGNEIKGAIAAIGVTEVLSKIGEFYELGTSVNLATGTFQNLSGGAAGAHVNLELLRQSTNGLVSDYDLMAGANKLLMMGLANSGEQAAELIQQAVTLGRAMGQDAGSAIQDFAALLANQSTPRLDNFGISSDAVRRRIEELKAAGAGASEAFATATLEEGRKAMERIGQTAGPASNAIDRFWTSLKNAAGEAAGNFATGAQAIANIVEASAGQNPIQQQQREARQAEAQGFAAEYGASMSELMGNAGLDMDNPIRTDPAFIKNFLELAYTIAKETPDVDLRQIVSQALEITNPAESGNLDAYAVVFETLYRNAEAEAAAGAANLERTTRQAAAEQAALMGGFDFTGVDVEAEFKNQHTAANYDAITAFYQSGGDQRLSTQDRLNQMERESQQRHYEEFLQQQREFEAKKESAARESQAMFESMTSGRNQAFQMAGLGSSFADYEKLTGMSSQDLAAAMPDYMQQGSADAITQQYEQAQQHLERMKELASQGLIGDDEVTKAQALTDQLGVMSNTAQNAADAFKNLSLSEVFGQSGGGMAGEVSDMVMQQLQNSGMSEEQLAAVQQQFDLSTGRETASSVAMSETVAPMIAELAQTDPAAAAQAMQNVQAFLQQAKLLGLSEDQIAAALPNATGIQQGDGATTFTVTPYGAAGMPGVAAAGTPGAPDAVGSMLASKYGINLPSSSLAGLADLGGAGQVDPAAVQAQLQNEMLKQVMAQNPYLNKDQILSNPVFQSAVSEATNQAMAQGTPGAVNANGMSTVSGVVAGTGLTPAQVMAAAGISDPTQLKPGTYTYQGLGGNAAFDPVAYAQAIKFGQGPVAGGGGVFSSPLFGTPGGAFGASMTPAQAQTMVGAAGTGLGGMPGTPGAAGAAGAGAASPMQGLKNDAQGMLQVVEQIKAAIAQIGGTRKLTLDLGVNDSQGVMALIKALFGGSSLAGVVSANGGTVPGTGNGRGPGRPGRD